MAGLPTISSRLIWTVEIVNLVWYKIVRSAWPGIAAPNRFEGCGMVLGAKIKALRLKKNKSLQDVADEVGASKNHIWDLETGKARNPSLELLTKIAKCLGVSVAELIGEKPGAKDDDPQVVAMYRELKELSPGDREAIQMMMDHLKSKTGGKDK
jgi:transcriptional regulator with XRE-family HTH domain